jgi:hypothetical protein
MTSTSRVRALPLPSSRPVLAAALAAMLASTLIAPADPAAAALPAATAEASAATSSYPLAPHRDFNSDGYADVLAIASNGDLRLYTGTSDGPLTGGARVGTGWSTFNHVFAAGDFSGDGLPDVMARDRNGNLFLYRGDGGGGWLGGSRIGSGWQGFTAILSPGDFNGDGTVDVIARDGSGRLFLYPGDGAGGWLRASQIGTGWSHFKFLVGPADFDLDGLTDLVAITQGYDSPWSGWECGYGGQDFFSYPGNGSGGFMGGSGFYGSNWCKFTAVVPGGVRVFFARDAAGSLWRYERTRDSWGNPAWAPRVRIGTGWSGLRIVG